MITITFKEYDKNNKLDMFNKRLHKQSCGRYELLKSKNNRYYMIDYDETGKNRVIRKYNEIKEIIDRMNLESEINYERKI